MRHDKVLGEPRRGGFSVELSRENQLKVERDLKDLRFRYRGNLERLNRWAAALNSRARHEDIGEVRGLLQRSLDPEPARWDGPLGVVPTFDEITGALRAKVLELVELYMDMALLQLLETLEPLPLLAREFNATLAEFGHLIASECDRFLLPEADSTLMTGFNTTPPPRSIRQMLEERIRVRRRREYFPVKPPQLSNVPPAEPTHGNAADRDSVDRRSGKGGFPEAKEVGVVEPSGNEATRADAGPAVNATNGNGTDQRSAIDAFISKLAVAGRKITRKNIWTVAGYTNATEFERFQRGDTRNQSAAAAFKRVLNMKPENFIGSLDKKSASK